MVAWAAKPSIRFVTAWTVAVFIALLGGAQVPTYAADGNVSAPFTVGEQWYVFQGYSSGTHTGTSQFGLDLTAGPNTTSTAGRVVRAPMAGTVAYWDSPYGNLCVNTPNGRSYTLTHIVPTKTSGAVSATEILGRVAAAGQVRNNGVAHLHFEFWAGPGCYSRSAPIPLDTAHGLRMCGAPDLPAAGPNGGNGIWSRIYFAAASCGGASSSTAAIAGAGHWGRYNNGDHSAVVWQPPAGATFEGSLGVLLNVQVPGTIPLYSCYAGGDEFTSPQSNCEGQRVGGFLGFIYTSPPAGVVVTQGVWRCTIAGEHFDSLNPGCEGQRVESLLGYTIAQVALSRWNNGDHSAIIGQPAAGATYESSLGVLLNVQIPGTIPLYSCYAGGDEFTSPQSNCEGQRVGGFLGFIYTSPPAGVVTQGVWRCTIAGEHFDSLNPGCEGQRVESLLGYTIAQS